MHFEACTENHFAVIIFSISHTFIHMLPKLDLFCLQGVVWRISQNYSSCCLYHDKNKLSLSSGVYACLKMRLFRRDNFRHSYSFQKSHLKKWWNQIRKISKLTLLRDMELALRVNQRSNVSSRECLQYYYSINPF